jgi:hypothetical protein
MKKKIYEKPSMKVYQLQSKAQILAGSGDSYPPDAPLWDGECDSRRRGNIDWDDEDYREGE